MSPLLIKISKDFATLWTTIDPIGNVALFAGLTASLTRADRHLTALRAVIYATIILVAAGTVGQVVLDAIGIHMHSLKVAGGINPVPVRFADAFRKNGRETGKIARGRARSRGVSAGGAFHRRGRRDHGGDRPD